MRQKLNVGYPCAFCVGMAAEPIEPEGGWLSPELQLGLIAVLLNLLFWSLMT